MSAKIIAYTDGIPVLRNVRAVDGFFARRPAPFSESPLALHKAVWESETKRSGRVLDDDVSIVWFKVA